jgi:hypothetical protein
MYEGEGAHARTHEQAARRRPASRTEFRAFEASSARSSEREGGQAECRVTVGSEAGAPTPKLLKAVA